LPWHAGCNSRCVPEAAIEILIAEDDPHIRAIVLEVVTGLGHAPRCAANGAEALDLYNARGADIVLSDWMMPRLDGVELCRCVRSRPDAPYTYFILLTALADPEHRLAGMQAGADDYIAKPFNLVDVEAGLIAAERATIAHRRREALLRQARRSAAQTDPAHLLDDLLREAIALLGGSAGLVTRWDAADNALVAVGAGTPALEAQRLRLGEGASGRAALLRAPVLLRRTENAEPDPVLVAAQLESAIAVPLLDQARLLGTLAIGSSSANRVFGQEDVELLDGLTSTAVSALVALERGYAEMLAGSPDLPPHLVDMAAEVRQAADDAAQIVRQLRGVAHLHEHRWPGRTEPTIDLDRSQA